jgi:hypothetical protein
VEIVLLGWFGPERPVDQVTKAREEIHDELCCA